MVYGIKKKRINIDQQLCASIRKVHLLLAELPSGYLT